MSEAVERHRNGIRDCIAAPLATRCYRSGLALANPLHKYVEPLAGASMSKRFAAEVVELPGDLVFLFERDGSQQGSNREPSRRLNRNHTATRADEPHYTTHTRNIALRGPLGEALW